MAEGIEHVTQLVSLEAMGCAFGQGYLLGRPGPITDVATNPPRAEILSP